MPRVVAGGEKGLENPRHVVRLNTHTPVENRDATYARFGA